MDDEMVQQWQQKFDAQRGGQPDENISKAELRLTDIADTVQGRRYIYNNVTRTQIVMSIVQIV